MKNYVDQIHAKDVAKSNIYCCFLLDMWNLLQFQVLRDTQLETKRAIYKKVYGVRYILILCITND